MELSDPASSLPALRDLEVVGWDSCVTPTLYVSLEAVSIVPDRRGSRPNLEAAIADLARRAAPRLFAQHEEYPEAGLWTWTSHHKVVRHEMRGRGA